MSAHPTTSQALQPLHFPLWGSRLIEASACTSGQTCSAVSSSSPDSG